MNVLIAEDDAALCLMLKSLLTVWGHTVTSANDGDEAWKILCEPGHPHLLILDWVMPGIEGPEIVRRLRERVLEKPYYVIIMTSHSNKGSAATALNTGADDFVGKPFDYDELQARVAVGERVSRYQAELQELNSRIHEQSVVQERFLDMISHEYRTPLAIIQANIDIMELKEQQAGHTPSVSLLKIQHAIDRLMDMYEATLRRKGFGYKPPNQAFETINVEQSLRQTIAAATDYWGERYTCHFNLPAGLRLNVDRRQMQTAILNLLDNAAKYSPPNLSVTVRTGITGDRLEMVIFNHSFAPLPNDTEKLFQNFIRGSNSAGTNGTGQGLYLARSIIEQHGGSLGLILDDKDGVVTMMRLPLGAVTDEQYGC